MDICLKMVMSTNFDTHLSYSVNANHFRICITKIILAKTMWEIRIKILILTDTLVT